MTDKDRWIAEKFKRLVSLRLRIQEMRVFGSRARGDASADSDLDILVVLPATDRTAEKYISDCAWEAGYPDDVVVVPVVLSTEDVQDSPLRASVFLQHIRTEGVLV